LRLYMPPADDCKKGLEALKTYKASVVTRLFRRKAKYEYRKRIKNKDNCFQRKAFE
jgi:hypothetical protein